MGEKIGEDALNYPLTTCQGFKNYGKKIGTKKSLSIPSLLVVTVEKEMGEEERNYMYQP